MALIGLNHVSHRYGPLPLLDDVSVRIESGERVGLLGRNGAGKSTLLKILAKEVIPQDGDVSSAKDLSVGTLPQEVPSGLSGSVRSVVLGKAWVSETAELAWEVERDLSQVAQALRLDLDEPVDHLSAGLMRRVLLARAFVARPDLLILDEPTNHLDLEAIINLEALLQERSGALIFVTHDRAFLRRLATRIIDLDRGALASFDCDYDTYLERKQFMAESEAHERAAQDKKRQREETWAKRGPRGRLKRNQGRIRQLEEMRQEAADRRHVQGVARVRLADAEKSGDIVVRAEGVSHGFGDELLIKDFSLDLMRGDRVGILGPNGCGKSTLLSLLLKELEPKEGKVSTGTKLEIARFDQLPTLNLNVSVKEAVADDGDTLQVLGQSRHVMGYLQDFLFTPEQIQGPANVLSGGERHRLQLARLLAKPCNLLVLDEPTNDLDMETLDLLEELLMAYKGTLLLVSHDRDFLDQVVTSTLVFEPGGEVVEYRGGYQDYMRAVAKAAKKAKAAAKDAGKAGANAGKRKAVPTAKGPQKLSFKEKRELESLPDRIEKLEADHAALMQQMADPAFFSGPGSAIKTAKDKLAALAEELEVAMARWEKLESRHAQTK